MPDRFTIFLSYKDVDKERVTEVRAKLLKFAKDYLRIKPDDFRVFLAAALHGGEPWRASIDENLRSANWFVLFYTTPSANWQWCMYEAGVFASGSPLNPVPGSATGAVEHSRRRLICLCTPQTEAAGSNHVPNPLADLQFTSADAQTVQDDVVSGLIRAVGLDVVGGQTFEKDKQSLVDAFVKVFTPYIPLEHLRLLQARPLLPCMQIVGKIAHLLEPDKLIAESHVTFRDEGGHIFRHPSGSTIPFAAFELEMAQQQPWIIVIKESIRHVVAGPNLIEPNRSLLAVDDGENRRVFRPVATVARSDAANIEFDICFIELLDDTDKFLPQFNRCFKLLRICHSLRVETLERMKNLTNVPTAESLHRLDREMNNILARWHHTGDGIYPMPSTDELDRASALFTKAIGVWKVLINSKELPSRKAIDVMANAMRAANAAWFHATALEYLKFLNQNVESTENWTDDQWTGAMAKLDALMPRPPEDLTRMPSAVLPEKSAATPAPLVPAHTAGDQDTMNRSK